MGDGEDGPVSRRRRKKGPGQDCAQLSTQAEATVTPHTTQATPTAEAAATAVAAATASTVETIPSGRTPTAAPPPATQNVTETGVSSAPAVAVTPVEAHLWEQGRGPSEAEGDQVVAVVEEATGDEGSTATDDDEALTVFLHRTSERAWVITPLSGRCSIQLQPPSSDGLPPTGCHGIIWRLDDKEKVADSSITCSNALSVEHVMEFLLEVLRCGEEDEAEEDDDDDDEDDARRGEPCLAHTVSRRLRKVSSGMKRLKAVSDKLQEQLSRFQEDKLRLEGERRKLQKGKDNISRRREELAGKQHDLEDGRSILAEDRKRFNLEVRQAAEHLSRSLRTPVRAGDCACLPPDILFFAAQDEFARAEPPLDPSDKEEMQHMRVTPEAAFVDARQAFFSAEGASTDNLPSALASDGHTSQPVDVAAVMTRADALARALLAVQCLLDTKQVPSRLAQALEQLTVLAQGVVRLANASGRYPLSFAASCCTLWCGLQLVDHLSQKWDEAKPSELLEELGAQAPLGLGSACKRAKQLVQQGSSMRRVLRRLADYWDHRRRFVRCMANRGPDIATEADLRLLFLPRDVSPCELAAHVRRLSDVVEDNVVFSRRVKRPLVAEAELPLAKRPAGESVIASKAAAELPAAAPSEPIEVIEVL